MGDCVLPLPLQVEGEANVSAGFVTHLVQRLREPADVSLSDVMGGSTPYSVFGEVLQQSLDGVLVADKHGVIVHYNRAAEEAFGYRSADVLGYTLPKLIPAPILESFLDQGDASASFDSVQAIRRDGLALPLRLRISRFSVKEHGEFTVIYMRDLTESARQRLEIERLAHVDSLTSLPNRNLFHDRMKQTFGLARRYGRMFAILYIDLDKFKQINDMQGHEVGDRVLREIGRRLRSCVRETDTMARIGGDEFAAVLNELRSESDARIVAERIISVCKMPVEIGPSSYHLGASVGIALYPRDGQDQETLLRHADSAMYHAKQQGRGRFAFWEVELNKQAESRMVIERGLHRALQTGELLLHFQPQLDMKTGELMGAEALLRWQENGKLVQPGQFIPVAEETGLIVPMGEWVLREACKQAYDWYRAGLGGGMGIRVGVNLSVKQFNDRLPDLVFDILRETGLPARLLDLEITESFLASDGKATEILKRLEAGGVHLSVDDFGTGYSCLQYIRDLPLHTIKIDRSFVQALGNPEAVKNMAVVETIIMLAHKLGRNTLAEGVETKEQSQELLALGCTLCQGFLYARPLPAEEFVRFARKMEDEQDVQVA